MRLAFRLGILAAVLLVPSIAAADDSGWYLGAGLGLSHASQPAPLESRSAGVPVHYRSSSGDQDSMARRLEAGYWAADHKLGVQMTYVDLGQFTHMARSVIYLDCPLCGGSPLTESAKVKVRGETLAVTARWTLSESVGLIGRAGVFVNQATYEEHDNITTSFPLQVTNTRVAPVLGLSLGWTVTTNWETLLGLDQYLRVGDTKYGTFNVTALSVGVQYHF